MSFHFWPAERDVSVILANWLRELLIFCILGLTAWESAFALQQSIPFIRLSLEQGLSQAAIRSIAQDHIGYLWIGTQEGLNRYDGYDFTSYMPDASEAASLLQDEWIETLLVGHDGVLWVGTKQKGLVRINLENRSLQHFQHDPEDSLSLSSNRIWDLHQDSDGVLWIGTDDGLNRLDVGETLFQRISFKPSQSLDSESVRVTSIDQNAAGYLWVGTDGDGLITSTAFAID